MTLNRYAPLKAEELRNSTSATRDPWSVISPIPVGCELPTREFMSGKAPKGFRYDSSFPIRDENDAFLYMEVRYIAITVQDGKKPTKEVRPISLCKNSDTGQIEYRLKAPPAPRALFGLQFLARRPGPVLITEGARKAEKAMNLFSEMAAVSATFGADGPSKADFTPLARKDLIIWPDHDAASQGRFVAKVVAAGLAVGARSVRVVTIPEHFPDKWDLADEFPAGVSIETLRKMLKCAQAIEVSVSETTGWTDPTPIASPLPPVEAFCSEMLPECLRDYIFDVADRQQSPVDFVAVAAIVGLSALVGNRVRMAPKSRDDWAVAVNLWAALVGRPSMMKTPAMRAALAAVFAVQDILVKEWEGENLVAKVDEVLGLLDLKARRRDAEKALKSGNRDEARQLLAIDGDEQAEKPRPRIVINDATVESLGELLNENPRGLLLVRDELNGWLSQLQKEEFQRDRAFYLEAYNGDSEFTYDRISRGSIRIEHATVSVIGGIQPSRIGSLVRAMWDGSADDGLLQRLQLTVWPDDRENWKWIDRHPNLVAREKFDHAFKALHELPFSSESPAIFRFSDIAQEMFRVWIEDLQREARSGTLSSAMESHLLKMPATVASLALLFELVDGGRSEVSEESTMRALAWADYLRSHADRLYAAGQTMAENGAKLIIERRAQLPEKWTSRNVQRKGWAGLTDRDILADAIEVLTTTNHVREERETPDIVGGRPSTFYIWNPKLEGAKG